MIESRINILLGLRGSSGFLFAAVPFPRGYIFVRHFRDKVVGDAILLTSVIQVRRHYRQSTVSPRLLLPIFALQLSHRIIYEHRSAQACLGVLDSPQLAGGDLEQTAAFLTCTIFSGDHRGPAPANYEILFQSHFSVCNQEKDVIRITIMLLEC